MSDSSKSLTGGFILGALVGLAVGFQIGALLIKNDWRYQAIENHAAYYDCSLTTGECEFKWGQR